MKLRPQAILGAPFGTAALVPGFKVAGVTLRERADIACVLITSAVEGADVAAMADLPLAAGAVRTAPGRTALWLSPRSWLIQCRIDEELSLVARVNAAFRDKRVHAVPFTDALCWFELSGPDARDCLTEGGFLSLEPGGLPVAHAKRTLIAAIAAVVLRPSETAWLVGVERSRARYFADWLIGNSQVPPFKRLS